MSSLITLKKHTGRNTENTGSEVLSFGKLDACNLLLRCPENTGISTESDKDISLSVYFAVLSPVTQYYK